MKNYISPKQYYELNRALRDRLSARVKVFCGTIIENKDQILLIKEENKKYPGYDLPGGKLMWGEQLLECAKREVLEESGFKVDITAFLGVYQRLVDEEENDYIRFIFIGKLKNTHQSKLKDSHVSEVKWVSKKDLIKSVELRSEELKKEITDYLANNMYPIDMVNTYKW